MTLPEWVGVSQVKSTGPTSTILQVCDKSLCILHGLDTQRKESCTALGQSQDAEEHMIPYSAEAHNKMGKVKSTLIHLIYLC